MSLVEDNGIILSVTHTDCLLTTLFLGGGEDCIGND